MPPASYVVALDDAAYKWITTKASFVNWVTHYGSEMRIDPEPVRHTRRRSAPVALARCEPSANRRTPGVERVPTIFSVRFFQADDLVAALPAIRDLGDIPGEVAAGSTVTTVSSTGRPGRGGQG